MSQNNMGLMCKVLKSVPAKWRPDFVRFVEEGEASDEFITFLEHDVACRRACESILRADRPCHWFLDIASKVTESENDSLIDELISSNPKFHALVAQSKAGARKAFV